MATAVPFDASPAMVEKPEAHCLVISKTSKDGKEVYERQAVLTSYDEKFIRYIRSVASTGEPQIVTLV